MSTALAGASLAIALIAVGVAFWQGYTSRQQLELAKATNGKTDAALDEIRRVTDENRRIASELKQSFDDKIGRIVDQALKATERRAEADHESDQTGAAMAEGVMNFLGSEFKKAFAESPPDEPDELETHSDEEPPEQ